MQIANLKKRFMQDSLNLKSK